MRRPSTDEVRDEECFSYWRAAVSDGLIGIIAEHNKNHESLFKANSRRADLGGAPTTVKAASAGRTIPTSRSASARLIHEAEGLR
jgi:hypothetical protein